MCCLPLKLSAAAAFVTLRRLLCSGAAEKLVIEKQTAVLGVLASGSSIKDNISALPGTIHNLPFRIPWMESMIVCVTKKSLYSSMERIYCYQGHTLHLRNLNLSPPILWLSVSEAVPWGQIPGDIGKHIIMTNLTHPSHKGHHLEGMILGLSNMLQPVFGGIMYSVISLQNTWRVKSQAQLSVCHVFCWIHGSQWQILSCLCY